VNDQPRQREIGRLELPIRLARGEREVGRWTCFSPGLTWFFERGSAPARKWTTRARLHTVAADLHVPEEGLPSITAA
jgi:hypothetical protein